MRVLPGKPPLSTLAAVAVSLLSLLTSAPARGAAPHSNAAPVALEGTLITAGGACPVLEVRGKKYPLAAVRDYMQATLADSRLNGRELRVEGALRPDGSLAVEKFYTVKNGQLYRVRYYCETCHIAYLQPGLCYCCQKPTELQELPLSSTDSDTIADP